jgi:hypothetical protein
MLKKIIKLKRKKVIDDIIIITIYNSFIHSFISTNMWRAMCMILFVVVWSYVNWKQMISSPRACYDLTWMNRWSEWAYLSLISVGLWLMLQVQITMQFVICNMYDVDSNVHASTIRNRAYKSIQNYAILTLASMHSVFSDRLQCIIFLSTWSKRFLVKP